MNEVGIKRMLMVALVSSTGKRGGEKKKEGRKDSRESRTLRQIREMPSIGFSYQVPRRGRYRARPIAIFDIPSGRDKVFIFHETRRKNSESTVIVDILHERAQFT